METMPEPFDPYYTWLAIPPQEQPPNLYRLLGLSLFESNPEVIQHAADQRMGHLRSFQTSRYAAASQKLLNEVAAARLCLLNARRKAAYDARLRKKLAEAGGPESPIAPSVAPALPADVPAAPQPGAPGPEGPVPDGSMLGEYLLLDQLGSSRSGPVFKAQHRTMGRVVAIKLLSQSRATREKLERFRRKVKVLGRLNHPNLVAAFDAGQREGIHYLIMEYVDGQDLRTLVQQQGPLPVERALDYVAQAAAGLGYAHAHGVFHRNVKPSNLLVDQRGVVKVIGLGLARITPGPLAPDESLNEEITRHGRVLGTAEYMAPEQALDSHHVDARADIYSLGCVLYTLLAGHPPYPARTPREQILAHRESPIPLLQAERIDIPPALDAILQKMLAKNPDDRYASMDDVIAALRAVG